MIIFRTSESMLGAIGIAEVFDKHGLCVVSMTRMENRSGNMELDVLLLAGGLASHPQSTWLVVGQGAEVDIAQINEDIKNHETGYSEEEVDYGLGSEPTN